MWMAQTPKVSFSWLDGYQYSLKDMKTYPSYANFVFLTLNQNDFLDEIASRKEIYGAEAESLSYLLFEANLAQIVENDFDLSKLHTIKVPAAQ